MKSKNLFIAYIFFVILFLSCKKFVEVAPPKNELITSTVFSDDQTATSAIVGIYNRMMNGNLVFANGGMSLYPGLSADEIYRTSPGGEIDQFTNNAITLSNSINNSSFWARAYPLIYQANACVEGLTNSTSLNAGIKNQLLGEAKFSRAFCYFYLVNLYGDVPLVLSTDYRENAVLPRTSIIQVYQQIVTDLQESKNLLKPDYPTSDPVRPNKWAATALLARVYAYQKNWASAETQASEVINSGMYNLVSNLNAIFLANSPEAIWQLIPPAGFRNTSEGSTFIPTSATARPTYALTNFLLNAFDSGDMRKTLWLGSRILSGQTYYYPAKYKVRSSSTITEYNMVIRFAELYLIRAEARARQNNISGTQSDLNVIRKRAGLPNTTASTQPTLLLAIEHERQIELFTEWGHRWFDLKRTGRADPVLGVEKPGWQTTDALYPIPFSEIQKNVFLTQNPGY
jgi:hypothetical protein